jgi:hypothetical protein
MHKLPLLVAFTITVFAGCGTAVFHHKIEVVVVDPAKKMGSEPIEMAIFNHSWTVTEEWVRQFAGKTTSAKRYVGETSSTDMKFMDFSPPKDLDAGVFLPSLRPEGYYILKVQPVSGTEQKTELKWESFFARTKEDDAVPPLPAHYKSQASRKGWIVELTLDVPADYPKKP